MKPMISMINHIKLILKSKRINFFCLDLQLNYWANPSTDAYICTSIAVYKHLHLDWILEGLMKRYIVILLIVINIVLLTKVQAYSTAPHNSAQAATVIDVASGRILYEKSGDQPLPIASLTKIMTAIVAIEEGDLKSIVKTGKNAVGAEGSSIYLRLGEQLTLEDMLYGLMLRSGNDAAIAIAEHIGGSVEGFSLLMNEKASYLGLEHTHFVNPHGLDHPQHYSTAKDMAILTAYALQNPEFQKIVATQVKTAPLEGFDWDRKWFNKNKMLRMYPGADGVKTGYTRIAKRCLVSSATQGDRQIAVVVINDGNDWNDSAHLLDYGFTQFKNVELIKKNQAVDTFDSERNKNMQYIAERDSIYPLANDEIENISFKVVMNKERSINSPIAYLEIYLTDTVIDRVPLVSVDNSSAAQSNHIYIPTTSNKYWSNWLLFWRYLM